MKSHYRPLCTVSFSFLNDAPLLNLHAVSQRGKLKEKGMLDELSPLDPVTCLFRAYMRVLFQINLIIDYPSQI